MEEESGDKAAARGARSDIWVITMGEDPAHKRPMRVSHVPRIPIDLIVERGKVELIAGADTHAKIAVRAGREFSHSGILFMVEREYFGGTNADT
jgi:hypothetical protein